MVIQEGFDDMSLLACQVILEENENDVIISSKSEGIVKGEDSSVLAVSFDEAIRQNIDYSGIVIIGGKEEHIIAELNEIISKFHKDGKIIAGIGTGVKIINEELQVKVSDSKEIMVDSNVITLLDPELAEEFADQLSSLVS